jgi:hypothetical protein
MAGADGDLDHRVGASRALFRHLRRHRVEQPVPPVRVRRERVAEREPQRRPIAAEREDDPEPRLRRPSRPLLDEVADLGAASGRDSSVTRCSGRPASSA